MIPISISAEAAAEIRRTIATKNIPDGWYLRVGVRGGGCGVSPLIGFDVRQPEDLLFETEGIAVIMDKKHVMFLFGKRVEFHESADRRGFHISDPSVTPTPDSTV